jgi:hypothetical protein
VLSGGLGFRGGGAKMTFVSPIHIHLPTGRMVVIFSCLYEEAPISRAMNR